MKAPLAIIFVLFFSSCQFFETEKITSDTFYQEELKTIDWTEVDQFPVFSNCDQLSDKEEQKSCFQNTLASKLIATFKSQDVAVTSEIIDTVLVRLRVSREGELEIAKLHLDSVVTKKFPDFENLIIRSIQEMRLVAPAYKRGIPVATEFTLPIVLQSE